MNRIVLMIVSALVLTLTPVRAWAESPWLPESRKSTLPPKGFVLFCTENPKECDAYSEEERAAPERIVATPEVWQKLNVVNSYVNNTVMGASDEELYGVPDYWTYPTAKGDCEDYLLLKKRKLEQQGISPRALHITVVRQERGVLHAVLVVSTTDGDFVLDNRPTRNAILHWSQVGYTFLKWQAGDDPRHWVSFVDDKPSSLYDLVSK